MVGPSQNKLPDGCMLIFPSQQLKGHIFNRCLDIRRRSTHPTNRNEEPHQVRVHGIIPNVGVCSDSVH